MKWGKWVFNLLWIIVLTLLTQVGGILYVIVFFIYRRQLIKRWLVFIGLYLIGTFILIPYIAPIFGREKIKTSKTVKVHMLLTSLTNRNYVVPEVNKVLSQVSIELKDKYPDLEIHCLDANFPFINNFPLLPHLSHNDGKKLDLSLIYKNEEGLITNDKPSVSGYGVFEVPKEEEYNQIAVCMSKGYWQYDMAKYMTLGKTNTSITFSEKGTGLLLKAILEQQSISKVFIEPHLRTRLGIAHIKLRYHGCQAVRHDDHIHIQVK